MLTLPAKIRYVCSAGKIVVHGGEVRLLAWLGWLGGAYGWWRLQVEGHGDIVHAFHFLDTPWCVPATVKFRTAGGEQVLLGA
jgi:hypothetical protein